MEQPEPTIEPTFADQWRGLKQRVVSAIVMVILTISLLIIGGIAFKALVLLAALIMLREWDGLTEGWGRGWRTGGLLYVALPCLSLLWLRDLQFADFPDGGLYVVLYLLLIVWSTDIGAYFIGKQIGGAKLAPSISPKKTWAGLGGGVLAAAFAGSVCTAFSPFPSTWTAGISLGILLAIVSQAGDLFESWIKRHAGVKDSGRLIPEHGGLLDRVDGLIVALPVFALLLQASQG